MWDEALLARRIAAEPAAAGFLLILPYPTGPAEPHAEQLVRAGVAALVSLLPAAEAARLGCDLAALRRACAARGILFGHAPIADFGVPGAVFEAAWSERARALSERLRAGCGVAVHCRAGLGRSGLVAARLLVELGLAPEEAIDRVRAARPGAIETALQEAHLRALAGPTAR